VKEGTFLFGLHCLVDARDPEDGGKEGRRNEEKGDKQRHTHKITIKFADLFVDFTTHSRWS